MATYRYAKYKLVTFADYLLQLYGLTSRVDQKDIQTNHHERHCTYHSHLIFSCSPLSKEGSATYKFKT